MDLTVGDMQAALALSDLEIATPPAKWGDMRQHVFYGALYHWFVLFRNGNYKKLVRHRELPVMTEAAISLKPIAPTVSRCTTRLFRLMRSLRGRLPSIQ